MSQKFTMWQPARWVRLLTMLWVLLPVLGQAQVLTTYTVANGTGNASGTIAGSAVTNATVGPLARVGVTASSSSNNFRASAWPFVAANNGQSVANLSGSPDVDNKYIEFTLTPATGYALNLTSISFGVGRSATGPRQFQWRSSRDMYAAPISGGTAATGVELAGGVYSVTNDAAGDFAGNTLTLGGTSFTALTSAVTFRLYAYSGEASAGTAGLAGNLVINGTVRSRATLTVTQAGTTYANNGAAFDFGSQAVGVPSTPVTFTLTNSSNFAATLPMNFLTATGDFSVSPTPPAMSFPTTIPANSSVTVDAVFTPGTTGTRTGTLVITADVNNTSTYTVNVTGTGTGATPQPEINVQQASTDYLTGDTFSGFAATPLGGTSAQVDFTIQNTSSTDALLISSINTTGDFATTGTLPTSVAVNSSATVSVTFTPTAQGTRMGTLVINSNDVDEAAYTINLSANGLPPVPTLTAINPNAVYGGATYSVTLTGTNFGTAANTTVNFNGASLVPSFVSTTSITVALPVPAAGTTYPVSVTAPGGTTDPQTLTVTAPPAGFFEPFEAASKPSYTTGTVTLATGDYIFNDALLGTSAADPKNNTRSARIQAGSVTMATSKANGAGTITVQAANYDTDTNGRLVVSVSTDGGATFNAYTSTPTTLTGTLATYNFTANVPGNIRVRFSNSGSQRLNIDDLQITDYTGPAADPQIAVSQNGTSVSNGGTFSGFASTMVGTSSPALTFTITNSNPTDALTIAGFVASGTEFATSGTTPTTVAGGGTATFNVVFRPTGTGTRTGSITINNNSTGNAAYVLNFSATGIPFVAQPFTPGNLVVSRVGTGSGSLAATATPVFLDEYTTGTSQTNAVQSIALPTADAAGNQTLTLPGTGTTTGFLSRSIDGQYLTVAGYDAPAGTTLPGTSAAINRTVARVGIDAGIGVSTALTNAFSGGEVRSVATTSGTNLWLAGSVDGIRHTTTGATSSTLVASNITNTRVVNVFESNVYYSTGSGTTNRGIWRVNGSFPTAAAAGSTQIVATGNSSEPYGFVLLKSSSASYLDVLYVIDGAGQLLKYSRRFDSNNIETWTARGAQTIPSGARGLTGHVVNGTVVLYFNTASTLYSTSDATASDMSISGAATFTTLATAVTNTSFRSVAFAPELLDLGGSGLANESIDGGTYRNVYSSGYIKSTSGFSASGSIVVEPGATIEPGCGPITGTASFTMQTQGEDGARLIICDPAGLSLTGATGQVQVTGTRNYGTRSGFVFNNTSDLPMVTGPGFPNTVSSIATFSAGVLTLSNPLTVTSFVQVEASNINLNGQTLTLRSVNTGFNFQQQARVTVSRIRNVSVIGNTAVVQRAVTNSTPIGYRHYSSPVSGETVGTLATSGFTPLCNTSYNSAHAPNNVTPFPNVFGYDETRLRPAASGGSPATTFTNSFDKGWFVPTAATPWEVGRGYTVNISRNAVVDFAGTLNNGDITRTGLTRTTTDGGWHLLGNPYPDNISFTSATRSSDPNDPDANLAGMDAAIYVFEATSQYGGTYRSSVNGIGGIEIEIGQGFFARTSAVGTAGTVRFTNELRGGGGLNQFRPQAETRPLLRLNVADAAGTLADNAVVYFEQGATNSFDAAADAVKLANPSGLTLGTVLTSGEALSIDGRPVLGSQSQLIPLNLAVPRAGTYTFRVGSLLNLNGTTVTLRDALTGTRTALTATTVYSFQTAGTTANGRFVLEFQPAAAPLATAAQALAAQVQVYPNPASGSFQLTLPVVAKGGVATLTNALGQPVLTRALTGPETTFDVRSLAAGVYQLHLTVEGTKVVRRVVVK